MLDNGYWILVAGILKIGTLNFKLDTRNPELCKDARQCVSTQNPRTRNFELETLNFKQHTLIMSKLLTVSPSPHIHTGDSTQKIMYRVVYAMIPTLLWVEPPV